MAEARAPDKFKDMLDAAYFLENGGQNGPQLTVLPPGKYRLNLYLFKARPNKATDIPAGFVGVVKFNVQETGQWKRAEVPHDPAGVTIKDVRLVDSVVLPPELMVARLREQLAILGSSNIVTGLTDSLKSGSAQKGRAATRERGITE